MVEAARISRVLGVKGNTLVALAVAVNEGLPKESLSRLVAHVFAEKAAARRFQSRVVPEATFKRRARLTPAESERTERLARVIAAAESVWENTDDAREWLHARHPELGGVAPIEAALSELGARRAEMVLDRIEYGLPA